MTNPVPTSGIHHLGITVSDLERSIAFYADLLGFEQVADLGRRVVMHNGSLLLAIGLSPDEEYDASGDRFDENRVGLDHLSFAVANLAELEAAANTLDDRGITRGEIRDLTGVFGIYVVAFRDPDNIQLELTAPAS
ncbi:MAG: hypothetical protein GY759_03820 [Chloroflexi bacterium]|nr:hypothetical protein [Chloroflexota bacterium]